LISKLITEGAKFNFSVDANAAGYATFDPRNMSITFRTPADIDLNKFGHELFHALQNEILPNGTMSGILNDPDKTGYSNIEFEARIFDDLNRILAGSGFAGLTGDTNNLYFTFLQDIIDNQISCNFNATELANYYTLLGYFKQTVASYNKPSLPNMQPTSIQALFGCP